jgi:hypothetical protein
MTCITDYMILLIELNIFVAVLDKDNICNIYFLSVSESVKEFDTVL